MQDVEDLIKQARAAKPIVVDPNSLKASAVTGLLMVGAFITGCTALLGFFSKRDIAGAVEWIQGAQGLAFFAALAAILTFIGGPIRSFFKHEEKKALAEQADNGVVMTNKEAKEQGLK